MSDHNSEKHVVELNMEDALESNCNEETKTQHVTVIGEKRFLYDVHEVPPWYLSIFFALQQCFMSLSNSLSVTLIVADIICARVDEKLKARLLSTTFFMSGLCTFLQNTIGIRLPLYQGPTVSYIIPLLAMSRLKEWQCADPLSTDTVLSNNTNSSLGEHMDSDLEHDPQVIYKLQQLMGGLIIAGGIHILIGLTGIVGILVRFIGPVTIVPALTMVGLYAFRAVIKIAQAQWGVAYFTACTTILLSLYLRNVSTMIPIWTPSKGFRITRFPVHQVFSVLIAGLIGWLVSVILTETGALSDDVNSTEYYARTDSRTYVIGITNWFTFPYPVLLVLLRRNNPKPTDVLRKSKFVSVTGNIQIDAKVMDEGQFGPPSFHVGAFVTFLFGTIASVLDSIGDYYACAKICALPPPPSHGINRGIAVEGLASLLAGSTGASHATTTYGSNIGAIGITKVASLRVFQILGIIFMIFGVIGKIGAVCVTIPYSVVGGMQMVTFGILCGVMISNIQYTDMKSTRNHVIIGCSLFIGLMMPYWLESNPDALNTGVEQVNSLIKVFITNPVILAGTLACFLDNTVPGTRQERGLTLWNEESTDDGWKGNKEKSYRDRKTAKTYSLDFLPKSLTEFRISRYIYPNMSIFPKEIFRCRHTIINFTDIITKKPDILVLIVTLVKLYRREWVLQFYLLRRLGLYFG